MTKRARLSPSSPPALPDEASTFRSAVRPRETRSRSREPSVSAAWAPQTYQGAIRRSYRPRQLSPRYTVSCGTTETIRPDSSPVETAARLGLEARNRRSPCERSVNRPPCFPHLPASLFVSAYRSPFPLPTKRLSSTTIGDWTNPPSRNRHCWSPDSASTPYTWPSWLPR